MLEELRKANTKQSQAKAKARKNSPIRLKALGSLDSVMDVPLGADDDADEAGGGGYTFFRLYCISALGGSSSVPRADFKIIALPLGS